MNLDQIATKCFILALFIRDDGQRLLLGDGYYDFNQKLQHFQGNTIANDIVEIQGDNGQLLAGQVMRSGTQKFEGYIGDATTNRQTIEQKRSDFMAFFRIKHFYKVIYIFPDGTAIQRQRGYLTDAPTIPEIFQKFPEYSVALNFEDANYYEYAEDEHGDEIYAHIAELALAGGATGGLIWDAIGAVSNGISWSGIQTAQGEYIQITNDLDIPAKLASVEMLGKAEQTTYSGKNLANYLDVVKATNDTTLTFVDNGFRQITTSSGFGSKLQITGLTPSTTYAVSWNLAVASGTANKVVRVFEGTSQSVIYATYNQVPTGATYLIFTTGASATSVNIWFYNGIPSAGDTTWTNIMLEKGNTATAYEPYVGGTPAPNPSFPQPISVVTGENVVKIEGKNLLPIASTTRTNTRFGITITLADDGLITLNGTATGNLWPDLIYGIQNNTTTHSECYQYYAQSNVVFSAKVVGGTKTTTAGGITIAYNDTETQATIPFSDMTQQKTTSATNGINRAYIYIANGSVFNNYSFYLQVETGSTATTYEPYRGQEFEVNLGKNLAPNNATSQTMNQVVFTKNDDGSITANGTADSTAFYPVTDNFLLEAGTYTLSSTNQCTTTAYLQLIEVATGSPVLTNLNNVKSSSFTITSGKVARLYYRIASGAQVDLTVYPMLERGTLATSFAPYFTPIELAKIGNYQDRIYKEDSKWYIEKQVGKVVLDGTEAGWSWADTARYTVAISNIGAREAISDHFTYVNYTGHATTASPSFDISSNLASIGFHDKDITSLNNFKTWLSTHNTTVYYALATPTTTEITNEALIAQLDALGTASLYLGVNNIGTETLNAMPTLKIEYYTEVDLDGAGYEWEPDGNTAKTIVTVAGVDSAWPIWTIQGGAQNPTLTNITTGQTISWQGFVPEGQTLTINMAEMTADLAGANVFEYITGEWIRLAPGNNTLVYTAGSADKPSALSWNGVLA